MYGGFTYIYPTNYPNVGKYTYTLSGPGNGSNLCLQNAKNSAKQKPHIQDPFPVFSPKMDFGGWIL